MGKVFLSRRVPAVLRFSAILAVGLLSAVFLAGCGGEYYHVDYDGSKDSFDNAKDKYRAGTKVELYYSMIATDTDYSFYVDGEPANVDYREDKGYIIRFTMPEHDVKVEVEQENTMVYDPRRESGISVLEYYTATTGLPDGTPYREYVLSTWEIAELYLLEVYDTTSGESIYESYLVPAEALIRGQELIDEYGFRSWEDQEDLDCIDGTHTRCTFREDDGSYTTVSTDAMPENGEAQLDAVGRLLEEYIRDEYRLE